MKFGKAILCVLIVSLLVSIAIPMASAKKPGGGGNEPPADPAIAYYLQTSGPNPNKLMVMNDDGTNQAAIYEAFFSLRGVASWSPDGNSVTWAASYGDENIPWTYGVWRIDVAVVDGEPQGSNLQQLVVDGHLLSTAAWSPMDDEIIYAGANPQSNDWWIKAIPPTGGTPATVYEGGGVGINIRSLAWSSDGTQIAFIETDMTSGDRSIKIVERATGSVTHSFVTGLYKLFTVDWARQGVDTLVFEDEATATIYTIDIDTETVDSVTTGYQPGWSPDNSQLVYRTAGRKTYISKIELSTGDITKLASGDSPSWRW